MFFIPKKETEKCITYFSHEGSHLVLNSSNHSFSLTIRLWMTGTNNTHVNIKTVVENLCKVVAKLRASVIYNTFSRRKITTVDTTVNKNSHRHCTFIGNRSENKEDYLGGRSAVFYFSPQAPEGFSTGQSADSSWPEGPRVTR